MPKKLKERIQENQKKVKNGLHRQMIMDVGEGNNLKKIVALLRILKVRKNEENMMK